MPPAGDNLYQYSNPTFDALASQYSKETDVTTRIDLLEQIQAIMYDDLPSIPIISNKVLFGFTDTLNGIDPALLAMFSQRSEYWQNVGNTALTLAMPHEIYEPNIFSTYGGYDQTWMHSVYYGLFERAPVTHIYEPVIASSYSISPDKMTYTVDINPNAKFSDGSSVTAQDVKYTYQLYMSPDVGSMYYGTLVNALTDNSSITVIDSDTIEFAFNEPDAFAFDIMSYGIVEQTLVEAFIIANGYDLWLLDTALMTSCGPFTLAPADYDMGNQIIILRKNPYWVDLTDSDPLLDNFTLINYPDYYDALSDLTEGKIDIIDRGFDRTFDDFEGYLDFVVPVLADYPGVQQLAINMKHPIFGTGELTPLGTAEAAKYVRKAISHMIDREYIANTILGGVGVPAGSFISSGCIGHDVTLVPDTYDILLAMDYLEMAGYVVLPIVTNTETETITNTETETVGDETVTTTETVTNTETETVGEVTVTETTTVTETDTLTAGYPFTSLIILSFIAVVSILTYRRFRKRT